MDDLRQPLLPPKKPTVTTTETLFINPVIEDKDGYKPVDGSHLSADDTFKTAVSFPGEGIPLSGATAGGETRLKMIYITNPEAYTNVTYEEINNAIISSRKGKDKKRKR